MGESPSGIFAPICPTMAVTTGRHRPTAARINSGLVIKLRRSPQLLVLWIRPCPPGIFGSCHQSHRVRFYRSPRRLPSDSLDCVREGRARANS